MSFSVDKKNIILMYGGRSSEHEISLRSAASVLSALDKNLYTISCLAGDKNGRWYLTSALSFLEHQQHQPLPIKTQHSQEIFFIKSDV